MLGKNLASRMLLAAMLLGNVPFARGATTTFYWDHNASGNWSATHVTGAATSVPGWSDVNADTAGDVADNSSALVGGVGYAIARFATISGTVTLDSNRAVGALWFNNWNGTTNSSAANFTLASSNSSVLTLRSDGTSLPEINLGTATLGTTTGVTISASLSGSNGFNLKGPTLGSTAGRGLVLSASNTISGTAAIGGAVRLELDNTMAAQNLTIQMAASALLRLRNDTDGVTFQTQGVTHTVHASMDINVDQLTVGGGTGHVLKLSGGLTLVNDNNTGTRTLNITGQNGYSLEMTGNFANNTIGSLAINANTANFKQSGGTVSTGTTGKVLQLGGTMATGINEIAGQITGLGGLTKIDAASTWKLSGSNNYTGATAVNGGGLRVNGSLANTTVMVSNANSTLSGTGSIGGATTIDTGAILAPGNNSTGTLGNYGDAGTTLTFSNGLTINSGANLNFDTGDTVKVTGGVLTLSGGILTLDNGAVLNSAGVYTLFNYTGGSLAGSPSLSLSNTLSGVTAAFSVSGTNTYILTLTASGGTAQNAITIGPVASRILANQTVGLSGSLNNAGTAALNVSLSSTSTPAVGSFATAGGASTVSGSGTLGFTGSFNSGAAGTGKTVTVSNTDGAATPTVATGTSNSFDVVNARTFTSGTTVNLGKILLGGAAATVNANSTITTSGLHSATEDATLNAYSGGSSNGLTLGGSSAFIDGSNASDNITRTITGTITGTSGTVTGTFGLASVNELSGTNNNAANVNYTANVYEAASLTTGSATGTTSANLNVTNAAAAFGQRAGVTVSGTSFTTTNSNFVVTGTNGGVVGDTTTGGSTTSTIGVVSLASNRLNGVYTYSGTVSASASYTDVSLAGQGTPTLPSWAVNLSGTVAGAVSSGTNDIKQAFIAAGGSYNTSGAANSGTSNPMLTSGTTFHTKAYILAGNASADSTVSMAFSDTAGHPDSAFRSSDTLSLSGIHATGGTGPDGSTLTDTFVLQLTYDPSAAGPQYIGWYDAASGQWVNAVAGNSTGAGQYFGTGEFAGSYADYLATLSPEDQANLVAQLGAFGFDAGAHTAWAVLDHNSDFAVIPEPGTWGMILSGFGMLIGIQRFRKRR